MGVEYCLVNFTKREMIDFGHVSHTKSRSIAGSDAGASITTWYMLWNRRDHIAFVNDDELFGPPESPWPWPASREEVRSFPDRTDDVVRSLIHHKILSDHGFSYQDEDEPETVFMRHLRRSHEGGELPPLPPTEFGDGEC